MRPKKKSGLNVGFFAARSGQYNFSIKLRVMDYKKRATTTSASEASECLFFWGGGGGHAYLFLGGHNLPPLIGIGQFLVNVVENILKGSLFSIPSPSVKIQIMARKVCLSCKAKTLLGVVNKLLKAKSLLTIISNVLPLHLKQTSPHNLNFH